MGYVAIPQDSPDQVRNIFNVLDDIAEQTVGTRDCAAILLEEGTIHQAVALGEGEHCIGLGTFASTNQPDLAYKLSVSFTEAQTKALEQAGARVSSTPPAGYNLNCVLRS